ncbi:hypothetical protein [Pseudomonas sp. Irchel s3h14]|uniref:hypothetical protein n=1 Tax=Pseudomonas sp. Irchel s3h14 TaxID=2009179 RepID=UPI000BA443D8|nr:hypothetical protein [Pseudomonas sp. Irchel s3h14]
MNKEWLLPSAYVSSTEKDYNSALVLINNYAAGNVEYSPQLIALIENYFFAPGDAKTALKNFAMQLSDTDEASDILDDAESLAVLCGAIISVWSSKETEGRLPALLALIRHSWWLEQLWPVATATLARLNESFRSTVVTLAAQHFINAEVKLNSEHPEDHADPFTLGDIWSGHIREARSNESSWSWVRLLAELDAEQLLASMKLIRNPVLLNRVLESPEFYRNYVLWECLTLRVAPSFGDDGTWNGEILLPSLIRHGKSMLLHVADRQEHPKDILEAHVKYLLARLRDTLALRSDFIGIFKRWGTWLTRQTLNFPAHETQRKTLIDSNDLLMALADKIAPSFSPATSSDLDNSWEPWVYQSMLALLHSEKPTKFLAPDITSFLGEWDLTLEEWDAGKGQSLRDHARHYHATRPGDYACKVLGYSIALSGDFANDWLKTWDCSVALREILEFSPTTQTSKKWRPSDASSLMRTLVDIGLGILDCTTYEPETLDTEALAKSAKLFAALWSATTEMLSIDLYGDEFWARIQQHLAIRRIRWTIEPGQPAEAGYRAYLDEATHPKAANLLKLVSTNTGAILKLLPLLVQNTTKGNLRHLLAKAQIDMTALASSARKYQQAPERKFNIHLHHVDLIEELG